MSWQDRRNALYALWLRRLPPEQRDQASDHVAYEELPEGWSIQWLRKRLSYWTRGN